MSKIHIDKMAGAVKKYFAEAEIAQQKMKRNSEIYLPEFAEPENEKVKEQLKEPRRQAEEAIRAAQEAGRAEAAEWGRLSGDKLSGDASLLQFDISPEQFADLVSRHKGNGTMSALLKQYGDKMNKRLLEETSGKTGSMPEKQYNTWDIPTVEEKQSAYDKFAMGARSLLTQIDNSGTFGGGTDSQVLKTAVDSFGTPSAYNQHLFDLL